MKTLLIALLLFQPDVVSHEPTIAPYRTVGNYRECVQAKHVTYLFPAFVRGTVYFRNGTKRDALVNYHYQAGEMQFLNSRTDTLLFTGKYLIDFIDIGDRRFVLTENHSDMEVMGAAGRVMLAARTRPETAGNNLSHSGQHFSASEGNAAHSAMVTSHGGHFQWENNASGQRWKIKTTYFLIDQNRVVHAASRRAFLRVFGRSRRQLTRYIRENRIDFDNASDLQNLMAFCGNLTAL